MANKVLGAGYELDPIREYAEAFNNTVKNIVAEGSIDYYADTARALKSDSAKSALRKFFIEGSYDPSSMKPYEVEAFVKEQNLLFENSYNQMISEASSLASYNPLIGMATPMHKNILMNMVWDKGGIPKKTADNPKIVRTMEVRKLVKPDGTEIDMFTEQNKMTAAMRSVNPWVDVELAVGETGETEIVSQFLNGSETLDHLDIETYISAVKIPAVYYAEGDVLPDEDGFIPTSGGEVATSATAGEYDTWFHVKFRMAPGYGEIKRQIQRPFNIEVNKKAADGTVAPVVVSDVLAVNMINDRFMISAMKGQIAAVKVACKLDASMRTLDVCTVKWDETTDIREIGTDEGISTTVSPEELKDIAALYNINQLTKCMSLMKTALSNRRDDEIKLKMDESYERLAPNSRFYGVFDYSPREGYLLDHIEWRQKTFWEYFDMNITQMLRVLNDPNVTVAAFGEPDIIRRITPKTYTYQAPSSIGPVELDFSKTVVTSDKRVYSFVGSDKLRNNYEMIITLCPRNSNRIIYIIYDYQFYISNEIRKNSNPALPQVLAFDRYLFDEYQPIQGRIKIANPSGYKAGQTETVMF